MELPVRVLLVDDSALALAVLKQMLTSTPEIQVVGTARDGKEALEQTRLLHPDVICTDLHMPVMDGLELTRQVMRLHPCPILVISSSVQAEDVDNVFRLLEAGALDVFPKPTNGLAAQSQHVRQELVQKIRILSGVHVVKRPPTPPANPGPHRLEVAATGSDGSARMAVIGASTGGPHALLSVLSGLTPSFPIPVVCVQHISIGFLDGLVTWLAGQTGMRIRVAQQGEVPTPGTVYFAPEQYHLEFGPGSQFLLTQTEAIEGHRPSITVTMGAAANAFGPRCMGVLLTGMGRDGADGLLAIARAGGLTIAQDEASSTVYGMPRAAVLLGAAGLVLPLDQIGLTLKAAVAKRG